MSKKLSDIRKEIDTIDNQVHDLFMRRAALVAFVAQAKKKEGLQVVHPAREAMMMRRLLSRHDGALPRSTIVRIWRELISAAQLLQADLSVVISSPSYWNMAKNYFGSEIPMKESLSNKAAVTAVLDDDAYFAVMPWSENNDKNPWWKSLLNQKAEEKISVICSLPYGMSAICDDKALVIAKIDFMPSGDDISLIGLELNADISDDIIIAHAKDSGLPVLKVTGGNHSYIIEVKGFVEADSKAVESLKASLGECQYCGVIGGYPVISELL